MTVFERLVLRAIGMILLDIYQRAEWGTAHAYHDMTKEIIDDIRNKLVSG